MIWKLYKMMATILFRCTILACFSADASGQIEVQTQKIRRLSRIVSCVRQYYGLHPNFVMDRYGNIEIYLKQHLSEQDWALLAQLQVIKLTPVHSHHNQVLDIA
ncbi:hypothetical protein [Spirosoma flavum]|uniref:Uncharacterized protein n=1 Tax=Spirosoma flavum TaxID=2048557 RepID=A0ABW6AGU9_9BACT